MTTNPDCIPTAMGRHCPKCNPAPNAPLDSPQEQDVQALPVPDEFPRPWCHDCGPGYRLGDEGCRHTGEQPIGGDTGICRTCAQAIWFEEGEVSHRTVVGWSDRIDRGGDSLVCFKAVAYRHVPMGAREEAIYHAGEMAAGAKAECAVEAVWESIYDLIAAEAIEVEQGGTWDPQPARAVFVDHLEALRAASARARTEGSDRG